MMLHWFWFVGFLINNTERSKDCSRVQPGMKLPGVGFAVRLALLA